MTFKISRSILYTTRNTRVRSNGCWAIRSGSLLWSVRSGFSTVLMTFCFETGTLCCLRTSNFYRACFVKRILINHTIITKGFLAKSTSLSLNPNGGLRHFFPIGNYVTTRRPGSEKQAGKTAFILNHGTIRKRQLV